MKNVILHLVKALGLAMLIFVCAGIGTDLQARPLSNPEVRRAISSGKIIPLSVAMNRARAFTRGGDVLRANLVQNRGRLVYRFRMLMPGGRVRIVIVDAASGRVIGGR